MREPMLYTLAFGRSIAMGWREEGESAAVAVHGVDRTGPIYVTLVGAISEYTHENAKTRN
jgi:hypothetical protein